jgi:trans-aconitate methyltransferase
MDLLEARHRGFTAGIRHPWELARVEVVSNLITRSMTLRPGAAVLDIGCGDTFVAETIAARFSDTTVYAVDTAFTEESIAHYREQLKGQRVFVSSSLDAIAPSLAGPVSLVLLMDVIEHIADDRGFLSTLLAHPAISTDTQLIVTVPAYQGLFCSHDTILGHYRRYSNAELRRMLESSGLTVLDIGYFFSSLLPMRVARVVKERMLKVENDTGTTGLVTWSGGAGRTAVITRLLMADAWIAAALKRIGITLPGLSNYAVCRKSV